MNRGPKPETPSAKLARGTFQPVRDGMKTEIVMPGKPRSKLSRSWWAGPVLDRFARWLRQLLVSIDQLAYVLIAGPIYILLGGPTPSADETISSRVGRAAIDGRAWGIALEYLIDGLFVLLGEAPGHCQRNVESAFLNRPPRP